MKKGFLILIIIGLLGWAVYDFANSGDETTGKEDSDTSEDKITSPPKKGTDKVKKSDMEGIEKGELAPDFELETLEGETVHLSDYRGENVIVNFWATWCPPCRAEIPDLKKLYKNKEVVILAVNLSETEENEGKIGDFVEKFGMGFPVLMDANSDVANNYQVQAYPTSYMIDSDGRINFIALGAMNYDMMVQELEKMD